MRIRKHAAKLLLGSGLSHHSPPWPPLPAADVIAAEELFLCQLNCSPWDVTDSNLHFFDSQEKKGEEGRGIAGNGFGFGRDQEQHISGISEAVTGLAAAEPNFYGSGEDADQKKAKRRRRRRKNEDDQKKSIVVTDTKSGGGGGGGTICKKNDGKGWHCKRMANPNHTLCGHHLNQLKSYSGRDNAREAAAANDGDSGSQLIQVKNQHDSDVAQAKINRKTKTTAASGAVAAASESAGDGYYYYSGFGPWRGKSRSNGKTAKFKESIVEGNNESESEERSDAPVAGDNLDDDSDDDDNDDGGNVGNNKGTIGRKKRGRKPVKARSLKSLL